MSHIHRPEGFPRSARRKVGFPATALGTKSNPPRPLARYKQEKVVIHGLLQCDLMVTSTTTNGDDGNDDDDENC